MASYNNFLSTLSNETKETELNEYYSLVENLVPDPIEDMCSSKLMLPNVTPHQDFLPKELNLCTSCQHKIQSPDLKDFHAVRSFAHYLADYLRDQQKK